MTGSGCLKGTQVAGEMWRPPSAALGMACCLCSEHPCSPSLRPSVNAAFWRCLVFITPEVTFSSLNFRGNLRAERHAPGQRCSRHRTQEFQSRVPEIDWGLRVGHDRGDPSWLPLGSQDKGTFKGWSLDGSISCPRQLQSTQEDLRG